MMLSKEDLKNYVLSNSNLISIKQSVRYPELSVLKYKNKCFYKNIWNPYITHCRGLVIDSDWNIVVNPFTKIFNYGIEAKAPRISGDEIVLAQRKINGFMAAASLYKGEVIVSTTGSLDSDFVDMAREMLGNIFPYFQFKENITYLFEIVHPNDPHIINEKVGVYYLSCRENTLGSKISMQTIIDESSAVRESLTLGVGDDIIKLKEWYEPMPHIVKFSNVKEFAKVATHEGYVIYTKSGSVTKIKSPYYLFAKFLARCNSSEKILSSDARKKVDEEFYPVLDKVREDIATFVRLTEQERLTYIRNIFNSLY